MASTNSLSFAKTETENCRSSGDGLLAHEIMRNNLILKTIFEPLPLKDLKSCGIVSKIWHDEAIREIRKKGKIVVRFSGEMGVSRLKPNKIKHAGIHAAEFAGIVASPSNKQNNYFSDFHAFRMELWPTQENPSDLLLKCITLDPIRCATQIEFDAINGEIETGALIKIMEMMRGFAYLRTLHFQFNGYDDDKRYDIIVSNLAPGFHQLKHLSLIVSAEFYATEPTDFVLKLQASERWEFKLESLRVDGTSRALCHPGSGRLFSGIGELLGRNANSLQMLELGVSAQISLPIIPNLETLSIRNSRLIELVGISRYDLFPKLKSLRYVDGVPPVINMHSMWFLRASLGEIDTNYESLTLFGHFGKGELSGQIWDHNINLRTVSLNLLTFPRFSIWPTQNDQYASLRSLRLDVSESWSDIGEVDSLLTGYSETVCARLHKAFTTHSSLTMGGMKYLDDYDEEIGPSVRSFTGLQDIHVIGRSSCVFIMFCVQKMGSIKKLTFELTDCIASHAASLIEELKPSRILNIDSNRFKF